MTKITEDVDKQIALWKINKVKPFTVAGDLECSPSWAAIRATMVAMEEARRGRDNQYRRWQSIGDIAARIVGRLEQRMV